MSPTALTALLASLLVTGEPGPLAWPPKTVERLLKANGPPLLSARSASLQGRRLVAAGLDLVEPPAKQRAFRGRVLVYCEDSWEALGLWAATVGSKMTRATPFLGFEGPGAKFLAVGSGNGIAAVPLLRPAR